MQSQTWGGRFLFYLFNSYGCMRLRLLLWAIDAISHLMWGARISYYLKMVHKYLQFPSSCIEFHFCLYWINPINLGLIWPEDNSMINLYLFRNETIFSFKKNSNEVHLCHRLFAHKKLFLIHFLSLKTCNNKKLL